MTPSSLESVPGTASPAAITDARIRQIRPADVRRTVELIFELAVYEKLPEECHITEAQLHAALFAPNPAVFGLAAFDSAHPDAHQVGYALYFLNFSTWEGVHGIYLEDLYVTPESRGSGLGKALLTTLAATADARSYARVEWSVLDWNTPSIEFYRSLGAVPMDGWRTFRLTGPALSRTAQETAGSNGSLAARPAAPA
jgi:GNAT superfamily N-acetyltransferase